jgi:hypothetical protein
LHVPLSVAATAFAPDGEIQIISSGNIRSSSFLSVYYMLHDYFRYCMTVEIYIKPEVQSTCNIFDSNY